MHDNFRASSFDHGVVSAHMVVMRMRVDNSRHSQTRLFALAKEFVNFPRRVNDGCGPGLLITNYVGEILEGADGDLFEDHGSCKFSKLSLINCADYPHDVRLLGCLE